MRLLLLLLFSGCSLAHSTEPVNTAAIDVAIAEAIVEDRQPPELLNDFLSKVNQPPSPAAGQKSGGFSSPSHDTAQPLFTLDLPTLCVTIDGIDYDLDEILKSYVVPWTWPGTDEKTLREHLHSERHKVGGIDELSFEELKKLHAAIHEREKPVVKDPPPVRQQPVRSCPSGNCPVPQSQQWSQPRYGLFGRRRR